MKENFYSNLKLIGVGLYFANIKGSELPIPWCVVSFSEEFARKVYISFAYGKEMQTQKASTWYIKLIQIGEITIPVPIKRTIKFQPVLYGYIVFNDYNPLSSAQKHSIEKDEGSPTMAKATLNYEDPLVHSFHTSRSRKTVSGLSLKSGYWYRFGLRWSGVTIEDFFVQSGEDPVRYDHGSATIDSCLNVYRQIGPLVQRGDYQTSGTYLFTSDYKEVERYKNSLFSGYFTVPSLIDPFLAHISITSFTPPPCRNFNAFFARRHNQNDWYEIPAIGPLIADIKDAVAASDNIYYALLLGGNPYFTPLISEIRFRLLHRSEILYFHRGQEP